MLTRFYDNPGLTLVEWMPKGAVINAAQYVDTLMQLHTNINNCAVAPQHEIPYSETDAVDVNDTEI